MAFGLIQSCLKVKENLLIYRRKVVILTNLVCDNRRDLIKLFMRRVCQYLGLDVLCERLNCYATAKDNQVTFNHNFNKNSLRNSMKKWFLNVKKIFIENF